MNTLTASGSRNEARSGRRVIRCKVTLVGLIAVMMIAMEIRDGAGFPPEEVTEP